MKSRRAGQIAGVSRPLVVHLATIDVTVRHLLLPQLLFLQDAGYRVAAASNPGPGVKVVEEAGIPFFPIRIDRSLVSPHHPATVLQLARFLRTHHVHLLHVHTPVAAALGRVAAWLAGTPLVFYTAHGFYFHEHLPPRYRVPLVAIERALGRLTDHLFTQSAEDYATAVETEIAPAAHATVLGNGIDVNLFVEAAGQRETVRRELKVGDEPLVAFTGRFVHEKGIDELLQAVARLRQKRPEVRLLIIGGSLPSDRDPVEGDLAARVAGLGLQGAILTTGFTERVADYLSAADIFVLPSYREGMPRSILEAMAAGKPVVASNIRGCREEVVNGVTGFLVPVREVGPLSTALARLADDPDLRTQMGAAGQLRARALFDERLVFTRLLSVYQRYLPAWPRP